MPEGRRLCGVEVAGGRAGKAVGRRLIYGSGRIRNPILDRVDIGDGDQDMALRYVR
jgi:hypothetical protein